jgi:hypothetical protein
MKQGVVRNNPKVKYIPRQETTKEIGEKQLLKMVKTVLNDQYGSFAQDRKEVFQYLFLCLKDVFGNNISTPYPSVTSLISLKSLPSERIQCLAYTFPTWFISLLSDASSKGCIDLWIFKRRLFELIVENHLLKLLYSCVPYFNIPNCWVPVILALIVAAVKKEKNEENRLSVPYVEKVSKYTSVIINPPPASANSNLSQHPLSVFNSYSSLPPSFFTSSSQHSSLPPLISQYSPNHDLNKRRIVFRYLPGGASPPLDSFLFDGLICQGFVYNFFFFFYLHFCLFLGGLCMKNMRRVLIRPRVLLCGFQLSGMEILDGDKNKKKYLDFEKMLKKETILPPPGSSGQPGNRSVSSLSSVSSSARSQGTPGGPVQPSITPQSVHATMVLNIHCIKALLFLNPTLVLTTHTCSYSVLQNLTRAGVTVVQQVPKQRMKVIAHTLGIEVL